jgi:CRP-like cAMP-binding protein
MDTSSQWSLKHAEGAMPQRGGIHVPGKNRLLEMLPPQEHDRLISEMQLLTMGIRTVQAEANQPLPFVHFPLTGVSSIVVPDPSGVEVEIATIGNEGMVGASVFLGAATTPQRAFTQVPGDAYRLATPAFEAALRECPMLQDVMRRYTQGLFNQVSQSAACRHLHAIEQRLSRWLLMIHDRVGNDVFSLTQEFIAQMLGVRRPSVTVVAGMLQKAGLISYHRGVITVLDRERLEESACPCYAAVHREYERLLA